MKENSLEMGHKKNEEMELIPEGPADRGFYGAL